MSDEPLTPVYMEKASGDQMAPELEKQYGGVSDNVELAKYMAYVGGTRMLPFTLRNDYPRSFRVLNDEKIINAFAIGNGNVYITKGCLKLIDNEAQLAEILGHENGHIGLRHIGWQMDRGIGTSAILGTATAVYLLIKGGRVTDSDQDRLAKMNQTVASLILNGFGREQELEADHQGLQTMSKAGYDPYQSVEVFKKFQKLEGKVTGLNAFMQSHPTAATRIDDLNTEIQTELPGTMPGAGEIGTERFQSIVNGGMSFDAAMSKYPPTRGSAGDDTTWIYVAGGILVVPTAVYLVLKAMGVLK